MESVKEMLIASDHRLSSLEALTGFSNIHPFTSEPVPQFHSVHLLPTFPHY